MTAKIVSGVTREPCDASALASEFNGDLLQAILIANPADGQLWERIAGVSR